MTFIPDLSEQTYVLPPEDGFKYLSVGWLGDRVERTGNTSPELLAALVRAMERHPRTWGPATGGPHTCEVCREHLGHGEFIVEVAETRYLLPNMVLHYIEAHGYRLPAVVEDALLVQS